MLEKLIVLSLVYGSLFIYDLPKLLKSTRRDQIAYSSVIGISLYLSLDYVLETRMPGLYQLLDLLLSSPVKHIEAFFKQPV